MRCRPLIVRGGRAALSLMTTCTGLIAAHYFERSGLMTFDPSSARPSCPKCGSKLTVPQGEGFHCNACAREFSFDVVSAEPEAANVEREKEKVQARVPPMGFGYDTDGNLWPLGKLRRNEKGELVPGVPA
jgi:hypothetical protein